MRPILLVAACGSAPCRGGLRAQGPAATPTIPAQVATPSIEPYPAAEPASRTRRPAVALRYLSGGPAVSLTQPPTRPYIINVWAPWCLPCRRETPRRRAAVAAAHGYVNFPGIDATDGRASALNFFHHLGLPGIAGTLALDAGRIVYRRIGEISTAQLTAGPALPTGAGGGG